MYLGIDLGTSELKLLLLGPDGAIVAVTRAPVPISRPQPLWSEQHPADWWRAFEQAMDAMAASQGAALKQLRGIGLSGQMHGAVLLDAAGTVLRPAILWNDGRSGPQCEALTRELPELGDITGNLAMPGFTAPKLLWVREHEPAVFERTARVLLPKDWLRLQLTGDAWTDCSDASGTLWLDVGAREWSPTMLAACGLAPEHMPGLVEGSAPAGTLRDDWARRWGLPAGVVIAGGGGDNAASAVGIGAVEPGQGFVSLGTSGVVFVTGDRFRPNPASAMHAFCHALPGRWHQMSVMLSAASALSWATRLTGQPDEAALLAQAATLTAEDRARAPVFLPYLSGERTPHNDPHATGALVGLTHEHGPAAIGWSVIEGVSFGLRDGLDSLRLPPEAAVRELSLVGGGARSALWGQLLADVLGVALVHRPGNEAGGALGAARLGWLAAGGALEEVCAPPADTAGDTRYQPDAAAAERFAPRLARFRALYPVVSGRPR